MFRGRVPVTASRQSRRLRKMLWMLYKQNYRRGEKIEGYVKWLREQAEDSEAARSHFNYEGYLRELEEEGSTEMLSQSEVRRRRFIWMWIIAIHGTQFVLDDKAARTQFDHRTAKFPMTEASADFNVRDFDEIELKLNLLKEQAGKLKEVVGNPFEYPEENDFYHGRGIG